MAARRDRIKQGLGAVLKNTAEDQPEEEPLAQPDSGRKPASARRARVAPNDTATPRDGGEAAATDDDQRSESLPDKRHTSVYLYPSEFDMLDDTIYELRREHGMRIPKTELWRALLHLAGGMMADPERVDELLAACSAVLNNE